MTDGENDAGVGGGGGGEGIEEVAAGLEDAAGDFGVATSEALNPSVGGSTCWAVVLKNRARFGRRKGGGSAEVGILVSKMDFLIVLLNIVRREAVFPRANAQLLMLKAQDISSRLTFLG